MLRRWLSPRRGNKLLCEKGSVLVVLYVVELVDVYCFGGIMAEADNFGEPIGANAQ